MHAPPPPQTPASPANGPPPPTPFYFLFELGEDPLFSHPLWTEFPNTIPCLRIDVRTIRTHDGKPNWTPAAGPAATVESTLHLLNRFLDRFAPHMGPRNHPFNWYLSPACFGGSYDQKTNDAFPNMHPLLRHPKDKLVSGWYGPWAKHGIIENRRWATEYFDHLAAELKLRKLPDPIALILTSENGIKDENNGHVASPTDPHIDIGWVPVALADDRASDPDCTIDGTHTFKQYYEAARSRDGSPIPAYHHNKLGIYPGHHPANAENTEQYQGALRRLWEYARYEAFAKPGQAAFRRSPDAPLVKVGEYQAACDSKAHPVRRRPRSWCHQMDGYFKCNLQCPDFYGELPWPILAEIPFTADDPGWDTQTNWCREFNVTKGTDLEKRQAAGLALACERLKAHAAAAPHASLCPYVTDLECIPLPDMLTYLRLARSLGAWGVNIFMPKSTKRNHDDWLTVVREMSSTPNP